MVPHGNPMRLDVRAFGSGAKAGSTRRSFLPPVRLSVPNPSDKREHGISLIARSHDHLIAESSVRVRRSASTRSIYSARCEDSRRCCPALAAVACIGIHGAWRGKSIVNTHPRPATSRTVKSPSFASTLRRETASPSPMPDLSSPLCLNGRNICSASPGARPPQ